MAVDVYSENIVDIISPTRFSFSHDLKRDNKNPRLDQSVLDSTPFDFAFDLNSTPFFQSSLSTADELFSNGKILPTQIKKHESSQEKVTLYSKKKSLREFLEDSLEEKETNISSIKSFWKFKRNNSDKKRIIVKEQEEEDETDVKSFWKFGRSNSLNSAPIATCNAKKLQFRRSSSLNCTISGANLGSVNILSRSKSAPNQKGQIGNLKIYGYGNGNGNGNCNSTRVTPILNLPCSYISRLRVDLFGFGSLFCSASRKGGKNKK